MNRIMWRTRLDQNRNYVDIRIRLPRTLKQRRTARNWRKLSTTLPPGTNVTQIVRFPTITSTTPADAGSQESP